VGAVLGKILAFPRVRLLVAGAAANPIASIGLGAALLLAPLLAGPLGYVLPDVSPSILELVIAEFTLAVVGIFTAILVGKVMERRPLAEVGLGRRGLLRNTLQGFGLGTGMFLLLIIFLLIAVFLLGLTPGATDSASNDDPGGLLSQAVGQAGGVLGYLGLTLVFAGCVAVYEEIIFRGLLFRVVEEELGSWLALAISSFVSGIAHLGGPEHQSLLSVAPQVAAGLALAAAYMLTRRLWLSIAIHWAWDFVVLAITGGLLTYSDASSKTGTSDLPDATTLIVGSMPGLVVAIVLLVLAIRRRRIRAPRWMQRERTRKEPYVPARSLTSMGTPLLVRK
jgi:membrane protease YdiL (CAAX protease family)